MARQSISQLKALLRVAKGSFFVERTGRVIYPHVNRDYSEKMRGSEADGFESAVFADISL